MTSIIYAGDPHRRGTNPRNRIDDFKAAQNDKWLELYDLVEENNAAAIVLPGDVFDSPEVAITVLIETAQLMSKSPVPIYTTVGNHDIYGYNLETYQRSSLRLLEMLVPQLTVVIDPLQVVAFENVSLTFTPYSAKMDVNGYGYDPQWREDIRGHFNSQYKIHVAHGMLLDHTPPFDRYTLVDDVYTTADLVLTGHDHTGYGIYRRRDGKVFCNPGSLPRLSASMSEIERTVQVALISVESFAGTHTATIELIPLKSAKPGPEVLDRTKIEAEKARQYAMETFSALIQTQTGEKTLLDVNQIVEEIAQLEGTPPHIVKAAIERIDAAREKVTA